MFLATTNSYSQAPPPAPVEVAVVQEKVLNRPVSFVGNVQPFKRSVIASEVEGLVSNFPAYEGKFVKEGEVLVEFKTSTLELNLKEARASRQEAVSRYTLAKNNLKRIQGLYDKGVASIQELQDAESEKNAWYARLVQLKSQIEQDEYDLSVSSIKAPFTGYMVSKHTEVGQWVEEGGAVLELIEIDRLKIVINIPENYVGKLNLDDRVIVDFDALPRNNFDAKVDAIVPQADREARTFPIIIVLENKDYLIKSGMVARASFLIGDERPVKLVPKDAIVEFNKNKMVYVVNNGSVQPVPVSPGFAFKDMIQVDGNLSKGQQVVIRGNERLRPNQAVKVINGPHKSDNPVEPS
ncbi:MAG: efflux RND transporter periplasmic adaptor subunit [Candidatus Dadabacteria bacterium]|nr:efflux RND transporter periplasmic adaptor subunit [Candidatus Dadabacteria bacterium]NIS08310.1 efflux RND transporter periplasmic adaptor subunit [Candidatus Dadabacteria bacterium]NIV41658.1 efflux RND transporter periplasmic adaptor subunit [Candidatus Dadabacteria bacterium]NIY21829.1 efflux RND transporter periplasmic adaptor subunit [Candidatus Dadabacteria bacterium]